MVCRTSLDCIDNILFCLLVGIFLCLRLQLSHHLGGVMLDIIFNSF